MCMAIDVLADKRNGPTSLVADWLYHETTM